MDKDSEVILNEKQGFVEKIYGAKNIIKSQHEIHTFHEHGLHRHYSMQKAISFGDHPIILLINGSYKNGIHENHYLHIFILDKYLNDSGIELNGWILKVGGNVSRDYYWSLDKRTYDIFDPNGKMKSIWIDSAYANGILMAYAKLKEMSFFSTLAVYELYQEKVKEVNRLNNQLLQSRLTKIQYWGYKSLSKPKEVADEIQKQIKEDNFEGTESFLLYLILSYSYYKNGEFEVALHYLLLFSAKEKVVHRLNWLKAIEIIYARFMCYDFLLGTKRESRIIGIRKLRELRSYLSTQEEE